MGNASEVVGALKQDRHRRIAGELGATSHMIPVTLHVRSFGTDNAIRKSQEFRFSVFLTAKWTPYLMMATLFNAVSNLNDFAEDATYRLTGQLQLDGHQKVQVSTMQAPGRVTRADPNGFGGMGR